MWKLIIADYFSFTKKERRGITVLVVLILFFIVLPYFFPYFIKDSAIDATAFKNEIALLRLKPEDSAQTYRVKYNDREKTGYYKHSESKELYASTNIVPFYFDPNTASSADWKRLGLRDKTIATIEKYRSRGGKFYQPGDIRKIWGFSPRDVERLLPYVQIKQQPVDGLNQKKLWPTPTKNPYHKQSIEINTADATMLEALPGIGAKLSQRIVTFRDKLGGFHKVEQVSETFGLPDSTFQKIKPLFIIDNTQIKQLNINTAELDEMKLHPYIRYNLANAIIQYRTQHGNFNNVEELKKIMIITEEAFIKIAPYLKVN